MPETRKRTAAHRLGELFRPYRAFKQLTPRWITADEDPMAIPAFLEGVPSQPWRGLAAALRWLSIRLLWAARAAEARGMQEPEVRELTLGQAMDELHQRAEALATSQSPQVGSNDA